MHCRALSIRSGKFLRRCAGQLPVSARPSQASTSSLSLLLAASSSGSLPSCSSTDCHVVKRQKPNDLPRKYPFHGEGSSSSSASELSHPAVWACGPSHASNASAGTFGKRARRRSRGVTKWGLTFDMRRGPKRAKRALGCRLDGVVRCHAAQSATGSNSANICCASPRLASGTYSHTAPNSAQSAPTAALLCALSIASADAHSKTSTSVPSFARMTYAERPVTKPSAARTRRCLATTSCNACSRPGSGLYATMTKRPTCFPYWWCVTGT